MLRQFLLYLKIVTICCATLPAFARPQQPVAQSAPQQVVTSPYIMYPGDAEDGVVATINPAAAADLAQWAQQSKYTLERGLKNISVLSFEDKPPKYRELLDLVVNSSGTNGEETAMRIVLRNARLFHDIFKKGSVTAESKMLELVFLRDSLEWAVKLASDDVIYMEAIQNAAQAKKPVPRLNRAVLGLEYASFVLKTLGEFSSPNPGVGHEALILLAGRLFNDLNQDEQYRRLLAPHIMTISSIASTYNVQTSNMAEANKRNRRFREELEFEVLNAAQRIEELNSKLVGSHLVRETQETVDLKKTSDWEPRKLLRKPPSTANRRPNRPRG